VRILITGVGGQLGTDLARHCAERGDDVIACDARALDVGDRGSVMGAITTVRPTWWSTPARGPRWTPARPTPTGRGG
jgi:dTDP-4-dehydrorhamnose reductase